MSQGVHRAARAASLFRHWAGRNHAVIGNENRQQTCRFSHARVGADCRLRQARVGTECVRAERVRTAFGFEEAFPSRKDLYRSRSRHGSPAWRYTIAFASAPRPLNSSSQRLAVSNRIAVLRGSTIATCRCASSSGSADFFDAAIEGQVNGTQSKRVRLRSWCREGIFRPRHRPHRPGRQSAFQVTSMRTWSNESDFAILQRLPS
jgi:hypothetical protein